jgi:hypothetical protein
VRDGRRENASTAWRRPDLWVHEGLRFCDSRTAFSRHRNNTKNKEGKMGDARIVSLEANHRLGKSTRLFLDARWFAGIPAIDLLYSQRRDDYVQLELAYYF